MRCHSVQRIVNRAESSLQSVAGEKSKFVLALRYDWKFPVAAGAKSEGGVG